MERLSLGMFLSDAHHLCSQLREEKNPTRTLDSPYCTSFFSPLCRESRSFIRIKTQLHILPLLPGMSDTRGRISHCFGFYLRFSEELGSFRVCGGDLSEVAEHRRISCNNTSQISPMQMSERGGGPFLTATPASLTYLQSALTVLSFAWPFCVCVVFFLSFFAGVAHRLIFFA